MKGGGQRGSLEGGRGNQIKGGWQGQMQEFPGTVRGSRAIEGCSRGRCRREGTYVQ